MVKLEELKYDKDGLIPAVVVDDRSQKVLTVAYMNRASLEISIKEGRTCFWSRTRKSLWRKGESSGNVQHIVKITADCDRDALTVVVRKDGPACHTGEDSCFNDCVYTAESWSEDRFTMEMLYGLICDRLENRKPGSYTTYLFDKGLDKILKKIGEESTEVIIAGKGGDRAETVYEIADLAYHVMVLMAQQSISTEDVMTELASRHVIDKKIKQEKMT